VDRQQPPSTLSSGSSADTARTASRSTVRLLVEQHLPDDLLDRHAVGSGHA
jgi:hypothetical protein